LGVRQRRGGDRRGTGRPGRRRDRGGSRRGRQRRRRRQLLLLLEDLFLLGDRSLDVLAVARVGRALQVALVEANRLGGLVVQAIGLGDVVEHGRVAADLVGLLVLLDGLGVLAHVVGARRLVIEDPHLLLLLRREIRRARHPDRRAGQEGARQKDQRRDATDSLRRLALPNHG